MNADPVLWREYLYYEWMSIENGCFSYSSIYWRNIAFMWWERGDRCRMGAKWLFAQRGSSCCAVCIRRDSSQPSVQFAPILEWSPLRIFSLHCALTGGSVGVQRGIAWLPEP